MCAGKWNRGDWKEKESIPERKLKGTKEEIERCRSNRRKLRGEEDAEQREENWESGGKCKGMEVRRIGKNGRDLRARKASGRNCMEVVGTTEGKQEEGKGVVERKRLRGKG